MSSNRRFGERESAGDPETEPDESDLALQIAVLEAENRRLREEYVSARKTAYRRTALGLAAVGVLAVGGGLALASARAILFALGGTGLFSAILVYYLTPEQFVSASVSEEIFGTLSANEADIASELGLADLRVYVPMESPQTAERSTVRLFVPQRDEYVAPDDAEVRFVTSEDDRRGVSLRPSGEPLFREFRTGLSGPLADDPGELATQLSDAVVEQFEFARSATPDVDSAGGRVSVAVSGPAFGPLTRFDHPIASFVAVGLATVVDEPVVLSVTEGDDENESLLTCSWDDESP